MPAIAGVRLATAAAGIRYAGRTDVLLALFEPGTTAAGVFTRSKCPSAPVEWCRAHLKTGKARALVVNSGNANAFTGKSGRDACKFTAQIAARATGCKPGDVFLASTGVIGEPLKAQAFDGVMEGLVARAQPGDFLAAARAIMTTDTFPEGGDRNGKNRQDQGHDQRHRQGRRHDRARYGDHALLHLHRRSDFRVRTAGASEGRRRRHLQRRDDRRRHIDVRHADDVRDRQGGGRPAHRARRPTRA